MHGHRPEPHKGRRNYVGGDWYDAFVMHDGSPGLTVGDVQGHDVEAIAFLGQVRTSLRLAQSTSDTREVLGRANDLPIAMGGGLVRTCCLLCFDPVTRALTVSRAGHDPTVWATAGGRYGTALDRDDAAVLVVRYDGPSGAQARGWRRWWPRSSRTPRTHRRATAMTPRSPCRVPDGPLTSMAPATTLRETPTHDQRMEATGRCTPSLTSVASPAVRSGFRAGSRTAASTPFLMCPPWALFGFSSPLPGTSPSRAALRPPLSCGASEHRKLPDIGEHRSDRSRIGADHGQRERRTDLPGRTPHHDAGLSARAWPHRYEGGLCRG